MADTHQHQGAAAQPLTGAKLITAAILIGLGNFLVVLDTTIANVSIPHIAGGLGVSASQASWVITSYAVAEAITVPLTGWLARRFGAQRVFIVSYLAFGILSFLCGLSTSLGMLIAGRILLGFAGGTIMPLSQTLLLRIFPSERATTATIIWAMTTTIAPVAGPILGGVISDNIGWEWIFFINVPLAAMGGAGLLVLLRGRAEPTVRARIDAVGLGLLVVWIAALQILLDEGRNHDWFAAAEIRWLAVIAAVGFVAFLIWELTEKEPIVNLRVFRHRGFAAGSTTYALGYGAFFAMVVIIPLWLQQNMGYTATWAGYATGLMGVLAVLTAPIVGQVVAKLDARLIIFLGIMGLAGISLWRTGFTPDITFMQMAWPMLLTGLFMMMFFVPVTGLCMASVNTEEQADAAGISNFMRTIAGAFAASLVQTGWAHAARENQAELAGAMTQGGETLDGLVSGGMSRETATAMLTNIVEGQSVMLATLNVFAVVGLCFALAATLIWFAPKPKGPIDTSAAH
ncbi:MULTISPECIES: DHA2 family efflux MFS transporter permease subunit [unclassified Sphingomonas]|uniref:DHA2 family efflux MFS transporter permease subunit n=1 Tax=unclassified Sphingomonas TaxID=196159 RepID=UPI0006FACC63|nr:MULTISPECIES: DHA2 family efflux MFS transporter permease subunit [unclassified Sphingomonas]KQM59831.1 multidrug resistance protein B [Sphingomonas sp. Leaf16]KQN11229.1 multidrug resistance protein B [Sphingomonas sp. Leaf29]KQN18550.1 multidrug resistance protein B [Sphingomonas sp. Leaf32]